MVKYLQMGALMTIPPIAVEMFESGPRATSSAEKVNYETFRNDTEYVVYIF